jgi:hypothetical protein
MDGMAARLPASHKARRDAQIVADRARGLRWATIAERHGVTERQCRTVWRESQQGRVLSYEQEDPLASLDEAIASVDSVIEDLALLAESTNNDAVKLGAIRARLGALIERFALMRACGLVPRDLGHGELDVRKVVSAIGEIVRERRIDPEVITEMQKAIRARSATRASDLAPVGSPQNGR